MMKNSIIKVALAAAISFSLVNCSKDAKADSSSEKTEDFANAIENPVLLNNIVMLAINGLQSDQMAMNNAMMEEDYTNVEKIRQTWSKNLDKVIDKISNITTNKEGEEFKKEVLKNLDTYKDIVNHKYVELIDIRKKNGEDEALLAIINSGLSTTSIAINSASEKYLIKN